MISLPSLVRFVSSPFHSPVRRRLARASRSCAESDRRMSTDLRPLHLERTPAVGPLRTFVPKNDRSSRSVTKMASRALSRSAACSRTCASVSCRSNSEAARAAKDLQSGLDEFHLLDRFREENGQKSQRSARGISQPLSRVSRRSHLSERPVVRKLSLHLARDDVGPVRDHFLARRAGDCVVEILRAPHHRPMRPASAPTAGSRAGA